MTLTGSSAPRALADDEAVLVDGAAVVYSAGEVHSLNATAALVWASCDGEVTLEALADELAESFGLDRSAAVRDVLGVANELVDRNLIALPDAAASLEPVVGETNRGGSLAREIFQPSPACPGCGEGPGYEQQLVVAAGEVLLSIGADAEIIDALAACFGSHVVDRVPNPEVRASYGVVVPAGTRSPGPVDLSRLHRGPDVLLASRDPQRVLRALVAQVALYAAGPEQVRLDAIAVGRAGRVVVIPTPPNRNLYARAAQRHGLALSDASGVLVQSQRATVTIGPPWSDLNLESLETVAATRRHLGSEPPALPWGQPALVAIAVEGAPTAASVLGELGSRAIVGPASPLQPVLDLAASVPVVSGTDPAQIAVLLGDASLRRTKAAGLHS